MIIRAVALKNRFYNNFNLRYFVSSVRTSAQIFLELKPIQIPLKLEFLRNFSTIFRSDHRRCSIHKALVKNAVIFTEKQLWWSLFFNKVADLQACNFIKKRLQRKCFPVKFAKFLRTPFLQNTCGGCYCRQNRSKETKRF